MATLTLNLNDCIGQTVRIEGYRGDDRVVIGEVTAVRDIFIDMITTRTHKENIIARGRYLLTLKLSDGGHKSFYTGRCGKIEQLTPTQKLLLKIRKVINC